MDLQLFDNGALVADTGDPGSTYESTTPVSAHAGDTYVATGWIDGCYGDPGSCYWYYHMWSVSAQGQFTGGFPSPPPYATTFSNLQSGGTWTVCEGECPYGGPNTSNSCDYGTLTQGISSPSLTGASMRMTDRSCQNDYYDVLFYRNLDFGLNLTTYSCSSPPCTFSNLVDDVQFEVGSADSLHQLEFDPDYTDTANPTNTYKMSIACGPDQVLGTTPNRWLYWDSVSQWTNITDQQGQIIGCDLLSSSQTGRFRHLQIYATMGNGTYTYQDVFIDGQPIIEPNPPGSGVSRPITASADQEGFESNVWAQQEIDNYNSSSNGQTDVYYDSYNLYAW